MISKKNKFFLNKTIKKIKSNGFAIVNDCFTQKQCNILKKEIFSLKKKLNANPYFKDEGSRNGQLIIRDLILRSPSTAGWLHVKSESVVIVSL